MTAKCKVFNADTLHPLAASQLLTQLTRHMAVKYKHRASIRILYEIRISLRILQVGTA